MTNEGTFFIDNNSNLLGSSNKLLSIPLYKGMKITIHGHLGVFKVIDWNYHHGHGDEKPGLRIILKKT